jgi:hypothetical protein
MLMPSERMLFPHIQLHVVTPIRNPYSSFASDGAHCSIDDQHVEDGGYIFVHDINAKEYDWGSYRATTKFLSD